MLSSLRRGEQVTLQTTPFDQGSQRLIGIGGLITIIALLLAPILNHYHIGQFDHRMTFIGWVRVGIAVVGLATRYWAAAILGEFYTRTLRDLIAPASRIRWIFESANNFVN